MRRAWSVGSRRRQTDPLTAGLSRSASLLLRCRPSPFPRLIVVEMRPHEINGEQEKRGAEEDREAGH